MGNGFLRTMLRSTSGELGTVGGSGELGADPSDDRTGSGELGGDPSED